MKKIISAFVCLHISLLVFCQNTFKGSVKDAETGEALANVSVRVGETGKGVSSNSNGIVILKNISNGQHTLHFSSVGYRDTSFSFLFPMADTMMTIVLFRDEKEIEQVIVSSSRTNSRIENTPTRVEVLGAEEVDEEVGIKPGNIASLLGDVAGIQTQQTSAATGNTEMRVQGLPGKYTQILRDGVPLFGGYSGSFSVLQIPPLDLKQIEIVKGASSTLYGGGAIAGMINIVSKTPKQNVFEKTILLNQSSLGESNVNVYLSNRKNKTGFTFFAGTTYQKQADVNKDGFSDLPHINSYFIHPVLFIYPNKNNTISIGYNGVFEKRKGGDMQVIKNNASALHQYFDYNDTKRNTADFVWENKLNNSDRLTFKSTTSFLNRNFSTNTFGMDGRQLSFYNELSYLKKTKKNDWVAGINFNGENFKKQLPDSSYINNYKYSTLGIFLQDDWRLHEKFILETGFRFDHHNTYGNFLLPRFSLLYKINHLLTTRFGGGLGYKTPSVFSSDIDERDYKLVNQIAPVKAERSSGLNWDINYRNKINEWDLTLNQTFFITSIRQPLVTDTTTGGQLYFKNESRPITSRGFETYVQLQHNALEIYLGYTFTTAKKLYDAVHPYVSLSAKNKFAGVLAYEFSNHFRAGIEASVTGKQYLDDGRRTPAYLFAAAMMRYDISRFSFVLNCENLFDYRQTRKENIVSGNPLNPTFNQLWASIDGRVINFSVRIKL